jgi:hypothetical protein
MHVVDEFGLTDDACGLEGSASEFSYFLFSIFFVFFFFGLGRETVVRSGQVGFMAGPFNTCTTGMLIPMKVKEEGRYECMCGGRESKSESQQR